MNVEIAQRLAELRRDKGYSQEELAEKLGLSRQAVSKWERAESSPDTGNLVALAKLYGVTLDELLRFDDEIEEDMLFETQDRSVSAEAKAQEAAEKASIAAAQAT
ncbi:MAG: helix-turn-helix transcriptional regulator, partial [Raoultibacter sp.]